jgi:hypothetical protein
MPKDNAKIEIQIAKEIDSLSHQSKPNISKTAREFNVPYNRLRNHWAGGQSLFMEAVSADGFVCPPLIILSGK